MMLAELEDGSLDRPVLRHSARIEHVFAFLICYAWYCLILVDVAALLMFDSVHIQTAFHEDEYTLVDRAGTLVLIPLGLGMIYK